MATRRTRQRSAPFSTAASAILPDAKLAAAHTNQGTAATSPELPRENPRSRAMYAGNQDWS